MDPYGIKRTLALKHVPRAFAKCRRTWHSKRVHRATSTARTLVVGWCATANIGIITYGDIDRTVFEVYSHYPGHRMRTSSIPTCAAIATQGTPLPSRAPSNVKYNVQLNR